MSSDSSQLPDAQGRIRHSFHDIGRKFLIDHIGFDEEEYGEFKTDVEQLLGQFRSADDGSATSDERNELLDLAKAHLVTKWDTVIDRRVQPAQKELFYVAFMASCNRNVASKKRSGKWKQKKFFVSNTTQSTQDLTVGSADVAQPPSRLPPALHSSRARPRAIVPQASRPQTVTTPLSGHTQSVVDLKSQSPPPTTLHASTMLPNHDRERSLSIRARSTTPAHPLWGKPLGAGSLTWRQVQLRVSVKDVAPGGRALTRPLIMAVPSHQRDRVSQDTEVMAHWLRYREVWDLIEDHVERHSADGRLDAVLESSLFIKSGSSALHIRDDHDLHTAYNMWVRKPDRTTNDIWFTLGPNEGNDSDASDIPICEDPFAFGHGPPALGKRAAPDDQTDDYDGHVAKKTRHSPTDATTASVAIQDRTSTPAAPEQILSSNPPIPSIEHTARESDLPIQDGNMTDGSDVNVPSKELEKDKEQEREKELTDPTPGERGPDVTVQPTESGGEPSAGTGSADVPSVLRTTTDHDALGGSLAVSQTSGTTDEVGKGTDAGAVDSYARVQRLLVTDHFEPFRRGDEEHYKTWASTDGDDGHDGDYYRCNHVRPPRLHDLDWLRAAGFTVQEISNDGRNDPVQDEDVGTAESADEQMEQLTMEVSKHKSLEQWHPEMWVTIAKFLMIPESTRVRLEFPFHIPGANPHHARSPAQMFGNVWMMLNQTKVMGGVLADQVGSGKSRSTIAAAVADRAYINRLWDDWEDDQRAASNDVAHVRRHLPPWDEQDTQSTPRCPSARHWKYQCVCEWWGVTRYSRRQRGPTLIFANPPAMQSWIDEYEKLYRDTATYKNVGFGRKDGFGSDDRSPFRLVVCHAEMARRYNGQQGRSDYTIQAGDLELLRACDHSGEEDLAPEDRIVEPSRPGDRIIFLTTFQAYPDYVANQFDYPHQRPGPIHPGKPTSKEIKYHDYLRFGCIVVDEMHFSRTTPGLMDQLIRNPTLPGGIFRGYQPYLWLLSGTPFAVDVFREIGQVWVGQWEKLCLLDPDHGSWRGKRLWMTGFDAASVDKTVDHWAQQLSAMNRVTSPEEFRRARRRYVRKAVKFASRFIIQRSKTSRIQGFPTTQLPPMTRCWEIAHMNPAQQSMVEQSFEVLKWQASQQWLAAKDKWEAKGSPGPPPTLTKYLILQAQRLPAVRASTSFPVLGDVKRDWETRRRDTLERGDPRLAKFEDRCWSELTDRQKLKACTLRLTIDEIEEHQWDRLAHEKESPYHTELARLMDDCHKKPIMDRFWDRVAASTDPEGEPDKAVVMTCSPVSALIVYHYFKYGCNNNASQYCRPGRRMNVVLLTSKNSSNADKALSGDKFSDVQMEEDKLAHLEAPDVLICTIGTFDTDQNCGRARYALILEPQSRLELHEKAGSCIGRSNDQHPVFVFDIKTPQSPIDKFLVAQVEDQGALLAMVQGYQREAEDMIQDEDFVRGKNKQGRKTKDKKKRQTVEDGDDRTGPQA